MSVHTTVRLVLAQSTSCGVLQHIFTDENLYDISEREELERFATYMSACWQIVDADYDLVLEVRDDDDERKGHKVWCYYFVNHTTKTIFWLEKYNACRMIAEVKGITPASNKSTISESCSGFGTTD